MTTESITPMAPTHKIYAVDPDRLKRVGGAQKFFPYLKSVGPYRRFMFYDARSRILSETRKDRLGSIWLLINPVANGLIYYVLFGLLLGTGRAIPNFLGFLVIGVFLFQVSSAIVTTVAKSMDSNRKLVSAFSFPRITIPFAAALRQAFLAIPVIIAMLLLIIFLPDAERITVKWLVILPILALQLIFSVGIGMILGRLMEILPDIGQLISFVMRAWLYMSGVFYSLDRFAQHPLLHSIMSANPLAIVLDMSRKVLLYNTWPSVHSWWVLVAWAFGTFAVGTFLFWQGEEGYTRVRA